MSVAVNFSVKDVIRLRQPGELQPGIQISKAGGMLRGRYVGERNFVFGLNVQQVLHRLKRLNKINRSWPSEVTAHE